MRNWSFRSLPVFTIFFFLIQVVYAPGTDALDKKNFLWKVRSKTATVYLLGSIHFLKKDVYPLDLKIEEAFEKSTALVVEADVNDVSQIDLEKLMGQVMYQGNGTLQNHVSGETYELLRNELGQIGLPIELANQQRPWFVALTLTSMELVKLGFDPESGVDMHFLLKASGRKKILELESLDYQINLLSTLSDTEQEAFLLYTLKDLHTLDREANALVSAWMWGDTKGIESILLKSETDNTGMSSLSEKLLYKRNRNMVSKIEGFLKTRETYFVVVGAGHLVGDQGIIEMLRGKGYTVEQL
jgi:uncharacterized protein